MNTDNETNVNETPEAVEKLSVSIALVTTHEVKTRADNRSTVQHPCLWNFDYTGVTGEQLQELADRSLVILQQGKMRAQIKADVSSPQAWYSRHFKVKELLERERRTADPLSRWTNALKTMTPEQLDRLRNQLAAMERGHCGNGVYVDEAAE